MKKLCILLLLCLMGIGACNRPLVEDVHGCYLSYHEIESSPAGTRYYRDSNWVVTQYRFEYDGGMPGNDSTVLHYDKNRVSEMIGYFKGRLKYKVGFIWEDSLVMLKSYDSVGRLTHINKLSRDKKGCTVGSSSYKVKPDGGLEAEEREEYNYNDDGDVIEERCYDRNNRLYTIFRHEYSYKPDPFITLTMLWGKQSRHLTTKTSRYDVQGKLESESTFTYKYNDNALPVEKMDGEGNILEYYEYECE